MTHNELLRSLRYALKLNSESISGMCRLGGLDVGPIDVLKLLKKEDEPGFVACDTKVMGAFLDGLIISRRGERNSNQDTTAAPVAELNNNLILRKLRIALELNEEGMLKVLSNAGTTLSKSELSAMFRASGHRNYKPCGDQFLRNFIRGLTLSDWSTQKSL